MGFHGISWDFMGFHGISWVLMGFHGISWDIIGFHVSHGISLSTVQSHKTIIECISSDGNKEISNNFKGFKLIPR